MPPLIRLNKLRHLSNAERALLLEALAWLLLARIAVMVQPFERIIRWLGLSIEETTQAGGGVRAEGVGMAVRRVAQHTPWTSTCLMEALACAAMLRWRRLPGMLYLGMIKDDFGHFQAHAWVISGESILTGGTDLQRYTIVGAFAIPA